MGCVSPTCQSVLAKQKANKNKLGNRDKKRVQFFPEDVIVEAVDDT